MAYVGPLLLLCLTLTAHFQLSNSYGAGAPEGACSTLTPSHRGAKPQAKASSYTITLDKTSVKGGEEVEVQLGTSGAPFRGFLAIAVLDGDASKTPVGKMVSSDPEAQILGCGETQQGGITHSSKTDKQIMKFSWQAPNQDGKYKILVTIVQKYDTFWLGIPSELITVTKDEGKKDDEKEKESGPSNAVAAKLKNFMKDCGSTKGCFGLPNGCVKGNNCHMFSSWKLEGEKYKLQVAGKIPGIGNTQGHVSLGLSFDTQMGQDTVVGCVYKDTKVQPRAYYNTQKGRDNSAFTDSNGLISDGVGELVDGWVFCSFTHANFIDKPEELGKTFNFKNDKYYILLASASKMSTNSDTKLEKVGGHTGKDRGASGEATSMFDTKILGASTSVLIPLHGTVMTLAWIVTSSIAMFAARYYKQTNTDFSAFNKPFWFVLHVGGMFVTIGLTFLGIIFIFIEIGGYSSGITTKTGKSHPILGLILTGICVIQLTMGMLRPHPGTPKRIAFNWIHWASGNIGHIVGIACLFVVSDLAKSKITGYEWPLILAIFVLFHIVMHITLSIHTIWADKTMNNENKKRALAVGPMKLPSNTEEAPGSWLRLCLLVLYIVGCMSFAIALIVSVIRVQM